MFGFDTIAAHPMFRQVLLRTGTSALVGAIPGVNELMGQAFSLTLKNPNGGNFVSGGEAILGKSIDD